MSWKIYLIKHLDTDMKYVGYTEIDLQKRWDQHRADTTRSISKALHTESHRMVMELLEEVETRSIARILKQQYIQSLNSAEPNGWNRQTVNPKAEPVAIPKKWIKVECELNINGEGNYNALACPTCTYSFTHQTNVELFNNDVTIYFWCESCHAHHMDGIEGYKKEEIPPDYKILIYQHKGQTLFKVVYYIEDKK